MKIKFLVSIAGLDCAFAPGETAMVDPALAQKWIASGVAEAADDPRTDVYEEPKRKKAAR